MTKIILLVLSLAMVTFSSTAVETIDRYEQARSEYTKLSAYYPVKKAVYKKILLKVFTGDFLQSTLLYVNTYPGEELDKDIMFIPEFDSVIDTAVVVDKDNFKVINRTYSYNEKKGTRYLVAQYTLTKNNDTWRIANLEFIGLK